MKLICLFLDQGWRIEIKKYPKLTEVGAWRGKSFERFRTNRDNENNERLFATLPLHSANADIEQLASLTEGKIRKNRVLGNKVDNHHHHKRMRSTVPLESVPNAPYGGFYTQV
jgi:hypothetical protein